MALLFADAPFYDTTFLKTNKRWACTEGQSGNLTVESANGPFGDKWIQMTGYNHATVSKTVGGTATTLMIQFRYKCSYRNVARAYMLRVREGTTTHLYLIDDSNLISVYNGAGGAALGTAYSNPLYFNSWNFIELKVYSHDTAGTVVLKINGVQALSLSGKDTRNGGTPYLNNVTFGGTTSSNNGADHFGITHVIVMDTSGSYCNDLLGDRRVQVFRPTGAGSYAEFSPSTGANWECVNEDPPNDGTDYTMSDAVNERDTFAIDDIGNSGATIDAVDCVVYCKTDDGGSAGIKGMAYGGSEGLGPEGAVPSSYGFIDSPIYVDPDTSSPFTVSNFNSTEFGYKRSA